MNNNVLIVTGAAGHVGKVVASELGLMGYKLMLVDILQPPWDGDGDAVSIGNVDLSDPDHAIEVINQTIDYFGGVNGLINLAGGFAFETQIESSLEIWDRLYSVNVQTAVNMCQAILPTFVDQQQGIIINIGALVAKQGEVGLGAYTASKSAVARLTETISEEHKEDGIRANAVLPSILDTPANRASMPDADFTDWVSMESLAGVIAFLLSEQARDINGACIPVAGRI